MISETRYCPVRNKPCPIEPKMRPSSPVCFIAIPSKQEWKDTRQTVKEILEENGAFPYVVEEEVTAGRDILCKICEKILFSNFGVIELTDRNPNVMFEFGFILASQKPVFILYNKAIAEKINDRLPADISALERIEYYNQEELREKFSRGLKTYIEEQYPVQKPKRVVWIEANSEDIDLILEALRSPNKVVRLEAIRDLLLLSYRCRIVHDNRVLDMLETSLDDPDPAIRKDFLEILKILLRVEDETHKRTLVNTFIQKTIQISLQDENPDVRRQATDVLEETSDPRIIDPLFQMFQETNDENWNKIKSNVHSALRQFYHGGYKNMITKKMYELLNNPSLQGRIKEALEQIRRT